MAKVSRKAPPRKPIKARGALPSPRVAPKRDYRPWHKRRTARIMGALLLLILLGLGAKAWAAKQDRDERVRSDIREVRLFERKSRELRAGMEDVFTAINQAPQEFKEGKLTPEAFKEQTTAWTEEFNKLDAGLRARKIPPRMKNLTEARALLVDGTVVYIDAVKQFGLAASLTDPALRDQAIQQGYNLFGHATSVFGKGQRLIEREKIRLGMTEEDPASPNPLLQPAQLVEQEVPPPPPPGAPQGQGAPPGGFPTQLPPGVLPNG